ncbi:MAG: S53 family peptidase [Terriglobales bacterium]
MNHRKTENAGSKFRGLGVVVVVAMSCALLSASTVGGKLVAHNTPGYVSNAKSLGSEDPAKTIEVSIWLAPHNRSELDALVGQLYDRTSPKYRQFLTRSQFAARFAPTADEAKTVQQFFESHNLHVVKVGGDNFFVRARGRVADVQTAFHVQLNKYQVGDKVIRSNDRDPYIDGPAGALANSVAGLDTAVFTHPLMQRPSSPPNAKPNAAGNSKAAPSITPLFSNICFNGTETETFSTNGNGSLPIGTYSGNHLNMITTTTPGCGYEPQDIQTAYNLTGLYNEGYNGAGQTIGIIDWCGSSTILSDANAFSAYFGLPALTLGTNFNITYLPTQSDCISADQVEINLDVEMSHTIAPGANINLLVPPSASFQDIDQAWYTAIDDGLANVISGSYGAEELYVATSELVNGNLISEVGSALGISSNFSSGDSGNFTFGFPQYYPASVSYPADVPYATGVGGVTLALNGDGSIAWQAGWGNTETLLAEEGFIADPPEDFGFTGGAGGGPSGYFAKPPYQKHLAGKYRQLPDVSWMADPYTGVAILITVPDAVPEQEWQIWGGTSVACPQFSALWAIANQEAEAGGGGPLGQAAPYLYSLPAGAIYDIVPQKSKHNVTASIQEPGLTNVYTAAEVAGVTGPFISAIWDYAFYEDTALVITFGTDPGLETKKGWDNVTGVGTPNAQAFADSFYAQ